RWTYEVKTYETFEEVEEIVEETEAELIIACEKEIVVEDTKITEETTATVTEEEVTLEHVTKETVVVEERVEQEEAAQEVVITKETGVVAQPAAPKKTSWFRPAQLESVIRAEADAAAADANRSSSTASVEESGKMMLFDLSSLPQLPSNIGINADTGAPVGCIDETSGSAIAKKLYGHFGEELPAELSVERLCQLSNDEAKREAVNEVEAAPSLSFPKCKISGIPESLGDLTTESLVFEMRDSSIFDDESLGAMDLEEEQDILQFLVEQVDEDTDYTKLLLWTVYKSLTEGITSITSQSTKNAACILKKAGIQFQPQL
ncbi:hypothetical protein BGZ72_002804, partial [Mortierella alpina]